MNKSILLVLLVLIMTPQLVSAQNAYQNISANIDVSASSINVESKIDLPNGLLGDKHTTFLYLNKNLIIKSVDGGKIVEVENTDEDIAGYVNKYKLTLKKSSQNSFSISYGGIIKDEIEQSVFPSSWIASGAGSSTSSASFSCSSTSISSRKSMAGSCKISMDWMI